MVHHHCCVKGCQGDSRHDPSLKFHRFPSNKEKRNEWLQKINRSPTFKVTEWTRICDRHFVDGDLRSERLPQTDQTKKVGTKRKLEFKSVQSVDVCDPRSSTSVSPIPSTSGVLPPESPESYIEHDYAHRATKKRRYSTPKILKTPQTPTTGNVSAVKSTFNKIEQQIEGRKKEHFSVNKVKNDEKLMHFYTNFPNYQLFRCVFSKIETDAKKIVYAYYYKRRAKIPWYKRKYLCNWTPKKPGRARTLDLQDEFFLVLVKLRLNLLNNDLSFRFGISISTVSTVLNTWIPFLAQKLKSFIFMPDRQVILENMPKSFKDYPKTMMVIDCSETFVETPASFKARAQLWSNYKNHYTIKYLIGMTPTGMISAISKVWGGRASDKFIVRNSEREFLDKLEYGDNIMADRGFDIQDILAVKGVTLNIPPFVRGKKQLSRAEVTKTRRIARARIHVERLMRRIKIFHILKDMLPINMVRHADSILTICCALANLQDRLVE